MSPKTQTRNLVGTRSSKPYRTRRTRTLKPYIL